MTERFAVIINWDLSTSNTAKITRNSKGKLAPAYELGLHPEPQSGISCLCARRYIKKSSHHLDVEKYYGEIS